MKYKILSILIITILLSGCENIQRQLSMEKKETHIFEEQKQTILKTPTDNADYPRLLKL